MILKSNLYLLLYYGEKFHTQLSRTHSKVYISHATRVNAVSYKLKVQRLESRTPIALSSVSPHDSPNITRDCPVSTYPLRLLFTYLYLEPLRPCIVISNISLSL